MRKQTNSIKANPNNSTIIQILLDAEKIAMSPDCNDPEFLGIVRNLKDHLTPVLIKEIDAMYARHRYGEGKLYFNKFFKCDIWENLSESAVKVLLRISRKVSEDGCYLLNQDMIRKVMHMNKHTLIKALNELQEYGCITKLCTLKNRNADKPSGTVYMVNSNIVASGTKKSNALFESLADEEAIENFENNKDSDFDIAHGRIQLDFLKRTVVYNYEVVITRN